MRFRLIFGVGLFMILLLNNISDGKKIGIREQSISHLPFVATMATDSIPLPPEQQQFFSRSKNYVLVISTLNKWKSTQAEGKFFQVIGNNRKLVWKRKLPQKYGPRYVLVGDRGEVLMFDEWVNTESEYALMMVNRKNRLVFQHDFESLGKIMGVPVLKIAEMAKHGAWITSLPTIDASGKTARVGTGGKVLTINLSNGSLSVK
jgi:hypothetical protein